MIYANYDYYTSEFLLGRSALISVTDFNFYANKASKAIDRHTFNNATDIDPVKMCCCELAEIYFKQATQKDVKSEKVGEYSVTYSLISDNEISTKECESIRNWLTDTGLLYCGVE